MRRGNSVHSIYIAFITYFSIKNTLHSSNPFIRDIGRWREGESERERCDGGVENRKMVNEEGGGEGKRLN